jgi:hypothetical protein
MIPEGFGQVQGGRFGLSREPQLEAQKKEDGHLLCRPPFIEKSTFEVKEITFSCRNLFVNR